MKSQSLKRPDQTGFASGPRVCVITTRLDIGGTERHIVRMAPLLRARGIDISVYVLERGGRLEAELLAQSVPVDGPSLGPRLLRPLRSLLHLTQHLRRTRPDVAHFFLPEPYVIGSMAAAMAGISHRIMSRRSLADYQRHHPALARLERYLHRRTAALLGNSEAVVEQLAREASDVVKVGLIHNGIETPPAVTQTRRESVRRDLDLPGEAFVLAIVANLMSYKGHGDLLEALALIKDRLPPPWRLLVIGRDEGIGTQLQQRAAALGLSEYVIWLGERADAERLVDAANVAVLASHHEGFSNSLIEAMGRGIPVVATAVGGNLDAVVHNESGLLVPVQTPAALAEAMLELARDPELRVRLGKAGRARAETLFSLDGCVGRYESLYRGMARIGSEPVQDIIDRPTPLPNGASAAGKRPRLPVNL